MALDLIFLIIIAAFIILRLRSMLGTREEDDLIIDLKDKINNQKQAEKIIDVIVNGQIEEKLIDNEIVKSNLNKIKDLDKNFTLEGFIFGAKQAFQLIVKAYSSGDKDTLKHLLSEELYAAFVKNIDSQQKDNALMETTIISVDIIKVVDINLKGTEINICVQFKSEQINVIKNQEGRIISGNPSHVEEITDAWTFLHKANSNDPTWYLVKTD